MPLRGIPLTLCLLAALAMGTGCHSMGSYQAHWAMKCQAHNSYKVRGTPPPGSEAARHYERGWKAGYTDVANGADGCAPAVPPHCYWSFKYQNAAGQLAVQTWFQGYEDGALAAKDEGVQQYNYLPSPYRSPAMTDAALAPPEFATSVTVSTPTFEDVAVPDIQRLPAVEGELPAPEAMSGSPNQVPSLSPFEGPLAP